MALWTDNKSIYTGYGSATVCYYKISLPYYCIQTRREPSRHRDNVTNLKPTLNHTTVQYKYSIYSTSTGTDTVLLLCYYILIQCTA